MMIDFVKARLTDRSLLNGLLKNTKDFPDVFANLNVQDGTIGYPLKSKIENMELRLTEHNAYLQNSIHVLNNCLINGELQNHNDFTYPEICNSLDFLEEKVPGVLNANITQLEFGFNVNTSTSPTKIISDNILMHDFNGYSLNSSFNGQGALKRFDYLNYQVKIYDKGRQSGLARNLLRYEIRIRRTAELHRLNIWKLEDLKNQTVLKELFEFSMNKFDRLTIADIVTDEHQISDREREKLNQYRSSDFWNMHKARNLRNLRSKHKMQFHELLKKHDLLKTKCKLNDALNEKYHQLMN